MDMLLYIALSAKYYDVWVIEDMIYDRDCCAVPLVKGIGYSLVEEISPAQIVLAKGYYCRYCYLYSGDSAEEY